MRLNDEAEKEPDAWHWRIYANGIEVALRRRVDGLVARYHLRLTRRECAGFRDSGHRVAGHGEPLPRERGHHAGKREAGRAGTGAFCFRRPASAEQGRRAVVLTSLLPGEVKPGRAASARCGEEVAWNPAASPDR